MPPNRGIVMAATLYVALFSLGAVILLLRDALRRSRPAASTVARVGRTPRWVWLSLIGLFCLSFYISRSAPLAPPRGPLPGPRLADPWWLLLPTLFVTATLFFIYRRSRRAGKAAEGQAGLWFAVILGAAAMTYALTPGRPAGPPRGEVAVTSMFAFLGLMTLVIGGLVLAHWLRLRDPVTKRALMRAQGGDVDGAIRELLEQSELKRPSANRSNALGCLYLESGDYPSALERFDEAKSLGYNRTVTRANRALALRKSGRAEEACELYASLCAESSREPLLAAMYCLALADLGRLDEAREQLRVAEEPPDVVVPGREHREAFEKLLRECRDRLGESIGKPEGLHEL